MAPDSGTGAAPAKRRPAAARRGRRAARPRRLFDDEDAYCERVVEARDGTRLFARRWHLDGADGVPFVLLDGLGCDGFAWKYLVDRFQAERPILHGHYRGHGRSEVPRDLSTVRIATLVDDLEVLLDRAGVASAVFFGHSMGIQILLEAHRRIRSRIAGLVLMCGTFERPLDTWHNLPARGAPPTLMNRVMRRIFPRLSGAFLEKPEVSQLIWQTLIPTRLAFEIAVGFELNPALVQRDDFAPYMRHLGNMDMRVFASLARDLATHSAADVLPTIEAPTLVVGGGRDTFAPAWLSEEMARRIPGGEVLVIPEGSHATPIEHPLLLNLRIEKFLKERVEVTPAKRRRPRAR